MQLPKKVKIVEVSPRDGLQNEPEWVPTDIKVELINQLSDTGLTNIEVTSFVSPEWVPALADHTQVMKEITRKSGICYSALTPNLLGLETAIAASCEHVAVFTAVSDAFTQKNTHCTIQESLQRIKEVCTLAKKKNVTVRGYISCVLGCPFEGFIKPEITADIAKQLLEMGCDEISLGDTIGTGTPNQAQALIKTVQSNVPIEQLAVHFHDTYGQALANIYACLELGISIIDCSIGGLGGCPYANGAGGNVATEDVLYLLNGLNIETGVDLQKIMQASEFIHEHLSHKTRSKVAIAKHGNE